MPSIPHGDHEHGASKTEARDVITYAAVAFLHQELSKVNSIEVTQAAFDALDNSIDGDTIAALGINFRLGENGSVILTEVKRKDDA